MGVPKFYRWISERYPCLSEVIREHQIPDFDNLYLDMNGIIHPCSHPNDDDPHFRITEEAIFANICYYIDFVFRMIKPKKVFFMAVDGVAPRAKMNQQRGRRFRTAKTAVMLEEQAVACGEELPTEERFDSNCITPGTPFMARLHTALKGFVVHKISTDRLWQTIRVYLSGHETPGEGEHKIMDFIRYEKSQPGYNPNTRHCLYGLDADLIMLGLCSHEPYFSLLREEVKFGGSKKKQKRISTPEETTFHLLHISLLRNYLEHEFSPVKSLITFPFNLEKIVDDFVLMSFLVGNDFIPHLPQLHIHHDALPVLFKTYMDVLPPLGGYINEEGYLNLERFEHFMTKLSEYDFRKFEELSDDFQYLEGKSSKSKKNADFEAKSTVDVLANLGFSNMAISSAAEFESSSDEEELSDEESTLQLEFNMHKIDYYQNKLEIDDVTPEIMIDQAEGYVRAIQWNLHYYYNGVVSWSWYYPHHYSPYISDVKDFKNMEMSFELGRPFLPFQQLLAVLPKLSKNLLPESYQRLMCDEDSRLVDYYPDDFQTDLNGKQQEWEAVVLIPFIDEKLLVASAENADKYLTEEERARNSHGPHLLYTYTEKTLGPLPSFLPNHYPPTFNVHAKVTEIQPDFFRIPASSIYKGLCKGVVLDKFIIGFPTLKTLKHRAELRNEKVKVFQMVSQRDNMMLIMEQPVEEDMNKICEKIIGKKIYVGWPHLHEALVVKVTDGETEFTYDRDRQLNTMNLFQEKMSNEQRKIWQRQVEAVEENSYQRWGIMAGDIKVLVHVRCFSGSKFVMSKEGKVVEEKQYEDVVTYYALQMIVSDIQAFTPDVKKNLSVGDIYSPGSVVFVLVPQYYGSKGNVIECDMLKSKNVIVDVEFSFEPELKHVIANQENLITEKFMPGYILAQSLGMDSHFISRITGTVLVQTSPKGSSNPNRVNVGLNLKFNRKNEEVKGFSKRVDNHWLYSDEVMDILDAYFAQFPEFIEKLSNLINSDVVFIEDLYSDGSGPKIIKEVATWLKEQSSSLADRQTSGIKRLDRGVVAAIEIVIGDFKNEVRHFKVNVPFIQLYSPYLCKGNFTPDPKATFHLFDRVINVSASSSVPLGLKGTIIGIQEAEKKNESIYEILFDAEFSGGFSVGSNLKKGYRMPQNSIINISHGEQMRKSASPTKCARNIIPRFQRSAIDISAARNVISAHLQNVDGRSNFNKSSPKANGTTILLSRDSKDGFSPSHVLNNHQGQSIFQVSNGNKSITQTPIKPFYKADAAAVDTCQIKESQFISPVFSPNWSNNQQFVTPRANRLSGNYAGASSNPLPIKVHNQADLHALWTDLKRPPVASLNPQSPKAQSPKVANDKSYGQKVSVEELFQGVQKQAEPKETPTIQVLQKPPPPFPSSARVEPNDLLRHLCTEHFKDLPRYKYQNHGSTSLYTATVTLPNGENISSIPCGTKLEASNNASEKALACVQSSLKLTSQHRVNPSLPSGSNFRPIRPIMFATPPPTTNFAFNPYMHLPPPAVANFSQPPPLNIITPFRCDAPVMRHPQPFLGSNIPDSFVKANQTYLLDQGPYFHPQPSHSQQAQNTAVSQSEGEVFHLPRGGTASIRNSSVDMEKGCDVSSMIVPAQVMKQQLKLPQDSALFNVEWPDLPPVTIPSSSPESSTKSQTSWTDKVKPATEISQSTPIPLSGLERKSAALPNASVHPTGMTVLKPKKKRIAANFQNA